MRVTTLIHDLLQEKLKGRVPVGLKEELIDIVKTHCNEGTKGTDDDSADMLIGKDKARKTLQENI